MKNKNLFAILFLLLFCFTLTTGYCQSENTDKNIVRLIYAEVNPIDSFSGRLAVAFKNIVAKLSDGEIVIDIIADGKLGNENEVITRMFKGDTVDIARVSVSYLQEFGAYKTSILSAPYIFESREHFWNFVKSDYHQVFLNEITESNANLKGLFFTEEGFRHFFSKRPINVPSDLANLKTRVSYGAYSEAMLKSFGTEAVRVPFTEMNNAFRNNVIDAAEQPILNYFSNYFYKQAPNMILDGHTLSIGEVIMTTKAWDKLNDKQKLALESASNYVQLLNRIRVHMNEHIAICLMEGRGVNLVGLEDNSSWKDACNDILCQVTKAYSEIYQNIQQLK